VQASPPSAWGFGPGYRTREYRSPRGLQLADHARAVLIGTVSLPHTAIRKITGRSLCQLIYLCRNWSSSAMTRGDVFRKGANSGKWPPSFSQFSTADCRSISDFERAPRAWRTVAKGRSEIFGKVVRVAWYGSTNERELSAHLSAASALGTKGCDKHHLVRHPANTRCDPI